MTGFSGGTAGLENTLAKPDSNLREEEPSGPLAANIARSLPAEIWYAFADITEIIGAGAGVGASAMACRTFAGTAQGAKIISSLKELGPEQTRAITTYVRTVTNRTDKLGQIGNGVSREALTKWFRLLEKQQLSRLEKGMQRNPIVDYRLDRFRAALRKTPK